MADPKAVNGLAMAATAAGSAGAADQASKAVTDIAVWLTQLACKCTLPDAIPSAYHTLSVLVIVGIAMLIHLKIAKDQSQ
jgi:hypothetical protein